MSRCVYEYLNDRALSHSISLSLSLFISLSLPFPLAVSFSPFFSSLSLSFSFCIFYSLSLSLSLSISIFLSLSLSFSLSLSVDVFLSLSHTLWHPTTHTPVHVCVEWRLLWLLLVQKWCSSFVWNSQGAVFYAHRSERLWFADCLHIFYFSKKKRHVKRKKQLAQIIKTRSPAYI